MGIRIIYGKSGTGKSNFCFSEISKKIEIEEKIYIITPEQFSFTAEKKLMETIKTKSVINAEVLTLSRMAYRILNEVGGATKTHLTKSGKAMLVYSILNQNKKDLKFLSKSEENIDLSIRTITELKKHGITVENLKQEIEKTNDKYLQTKLKDISTIYENFEEKISDKYIEETGLLDILAKNISKVDMVRDALVYIDEFAGFTKQEYEVIKEITKIAKQVNIVITTDNLKLNTNPDIDIYYSNKQTISKIYKLIEENNLKIEEPVHLENQYRFKTEELKHISDNLYNIKSTKYEKNVENIHLFLAKNQYSEIENIARTITKLIKEKNIRYKDISVITNKIENYNSLARSIFAQYDIPVFIDEKRDLNQNIIIQYILSILELLNSNFSKDAVFNYIKLGFLEIDEDEIFKLENYCTKWGIKNNKWKKDFEHEKENENKKQEIERLNELRKQIINPILKLKENIAKEKTARKITTEIYEFIQKQDIEQKIDMKINELEEKGLIDLANEYKSSYKILLDIFDEIVVLFEDEKITIDQYTKIIKVGLRNSGLGKIPGTQDQVILGDVDRSRSHKVDYVFIIGLNDGSFPSVNKEEGFLNDKDRETLKENGIELAKGTIEQLYEDNFNIYKTFTTAEKQIYMSYSSSDGEGKSLRPSILITKIKKMFPNLKEESDVIQKQYEIINEKITYEQLLDKISKLAKKEKIEEIWYQIYNYYKEKIEYKEKLQKDLKGLTYTNIPESIQQEIIDKLYGKTLVTSISKLEKYSGCPFSYYLQYGLKLKEKEELKIQSFDTGSFMHEIIDKFFKYVRKEQMELAKLEEYDIEKIVSEIVEEELSEHKNYMFTATPKYKVLVRRLKRIISKALKYIIQTIIYSDFSIQGTEIEFGKNKMYEPIVLELGNGKKVEIIGKIDRMDIAENEDGKYLRIIDYKSSTKDIDLNEVYAGLQIQLLTYTDAVCKKEDFMAAGVFYFSLLEQMITAKNKISEEKIEEMIAKNFKMKGLILADVKIIKMNDNTLKTGSSKLVPAALTASGEINRKRTNGVSKENFSVLQKYIDKTIKQISKEILSGNIEIKPYNKKGKTACEYCSYKTICGFNPRQCNNNYRYIDKKTNDDILLKMKKDLNE